MIGTKKQLVNELMDLPDGMYELKEWKPKKSRNQNGYYWALCTEIADVLRKSKTEVHNLLLRDYGQPILAGGSKIYSLIKDNDRIEKEILKAETYHIKPTSFVKDKDGIMYRAYYSLLGSRYYNTKEMSILLDGCIQEAESVGIATLPRTEVERMKQEDAAIEARRRKKCNSS